MEDTYQSFPDGGLTRDEVIALIAAVGQPKDYDGTQNESPTVREFLAMADTWPTIRFTGYTIGKPRPDWRVGIEGYRITDLTAKQALQLVLDERRSNDPDELHAIDAGDDRYTVRAWWD